MRILLTPGRLDRLRTQADGTARNPATKRNARALVAEMNLRLRVLGVPFVPANAWDAIRAVYDTSTAWSTAHIASACDVRTDELVRLTAGLARELCHYDDGDLVPAAIWMAAARRAAE